MKKMFFGEIGAEATRDARARGVANSEDKLFIGEVHQDIVFVGAGTPEWVIQCLKNDDTSSTGVIKTENSDKKVDDKAASSDADSSFKLR